MVAYDPKDFTPLTPEKREIRESDLEAMKELPIDTLFEDEALAPLDANQANEVPNEEKEGTEPDF